MIFDLVLKGHGAFHLQDRLHTESATYHDEQNLLHSSGAAADGRGAWVVLDRHR
jgi:hypothetical protein